MPKRNVYVSEELDELIQSHEGQVPFSQIVTKAIEDYLGTKICPTCGQSVKITKAAKAPVRSAVKTKKKAVPNQTLQTMPWQELRTLGRSIGADMLTRKRAELIASIQEIQHES